jgi:hypothetical protein
VSVPAGTTVAFDPDLTTGYHLDVTNNTGDATATSGGSYALDLDFRVWNRLGAPGAITWLIVGTGSSTFVAHTLGNRGTYGDANNTGAATLTVPAPGSTGSATIYARVIAAGTQQQAEAAWAGGWTGTPPTANVELFVPIGTLTVN